MVDSGRLVKDSKIRALVRRGAGGLAAAGARTRLMLLCWLAAAALLLPAPPAARAGDVVALVAFGDSLIAGLGLPRAKAFPSRLEAALRKRGHAVRVIDAAVSGDTTAAGLARLDWAVPDEADAVIVELGANDALRGLSPAKTHDNLDRILTRLRARGKAVLLAGMLAPRNLGREYAGAFDAIYPSLADKHGVLLYPFFLDGVAGERELNLDDGIHPNASGVAIIVERILPVVERLIQQVRINERRRPGQ